MKAWTSLFLVAVLFSAAKTAQAAVDVDISFGSRHHHHGGYVQYRTSDPVYTTWYPSSTTYVYTSPTYYSRPGYYYSTRSTGYNTWYGDRRYRHYGHRH